MTNYNPNTTTRLEKQMGGYSNTHKGLYDISAIVKPKVDDLYKGYKLPADHKCGITDDGVRYCTHTNHIMYESVSKNYCSVNDLPHEFEIGFYVTEYYL